MVTLSNIGISVDKGTIPRIYKQPFMLSSIYLSIDKGTIPPKNYFKTKIQNIGVYVEKAEPSKLNYQIIQNKYGTTRKTNY